MASVKLSYMPHNETNRVFSQYSPAEPASRSSSAVGSGIWASAPPATPQSSSSSFIGSTWGSPLAMSNQQGASSYGSSGAPAGSANNAYQPTPAKLLADLTVGSEPVQDRTSPGPGIANAFPSSQSFNSSGSRISSRRESQTEGGSPLVPSPPATPAGAAGHASSSSGSAVDEIINTAIVVKNIPFAIKKEQLIEFMTQLGLPLPYAFNYHFDNGVFRGLAFANFTTADETAAVISTLNGRELGGRRLRVEYKKMLPFQERERIEREKRERRGQLEEQHQQTVHASQASNAPASSASSSHSGPNSPPLAHAPATGGVSVNANVAMSMPKADLNDPETLQMYSSLLMFKHDLTKSELIIPCAAASGLSVNQTFILGSLCRLLDLQSGTNEEQDIVISKPLDAETLYQSEAGGDTQAYLSGIFRAALVTPMASRRVSPAGVPGVPQNMSSLSTLNRWNSVGSLSGLPGVGMGIMPAQSWAGPPGQGAVPTSQVSSNDPAGRNKFYETAFPHGAQGGADRRL